MAYNKAVVDRNREAREVVGNPVLAAGESLLTPEMLEYWRQWFRLPPQATQVAVYARLGIVAAIASVSRRR